MKNNFLNKKGFIQHYKTGAGFTLVELLVVIAIIGILSTVAVVNLNSARDKAKVAALEHAMASVLPAIALCHDSGGTIQNGQATPADCITMPVYPPNSIFGDGQLCIDPPMDWPTLPDGAVRYNCVYDNGGFEYTARIASYTVFCSTVLGCRTY
jgi:prepilin-type N-terminal cleavage/methylation domain-containing protein